MFAFLWLANLLGCPSQPDVVAESVRALGASPARDTGTAIPEAAVDGLQTGDAPLDLDFRDTATAFAAPVMSPRVSAQ